ncbi:uncharacterized protein LOC125947829 [Dermacentor silvarum]|uniref:uncharacterized protein LOC125947829 n=1 Tax=Dermacentor silvarum TaxID=543639 RepID=UPI002100929C|nr:uncharacterized protein LOC125947829 [Dermacentor silvarum]
MPLNKWHYIIKCTSEAKCALGLAQHLWTPTQAGERSPTGPASRTISDASGKRLATPEKVAAVKNCLEKYIGEHPMGPPAPPCFCNKAPLELLHRSGREGKRVWKM